MEDIIKKFKFKAAGVILNAPASLEKYFIKLGFITLLDKKIKSENTLIFVNNSKEFLEFLNKELKSIQPDSVLWFAYPKGSSGIKNRY
jgi:hypothetical protein